jgi:HlyD family secretion protein
MSTRPISAMLRSATTRASPLGRIRAKCCPPVIAQLRYAPQIIDGVVTYTAVLSIENADLRLRPGMTATAEITVAEIPAILTIPNAALRFAPAAEAEEAGGGSGLLGLLIRPRTGPRRAAAGCAPSGRCAAAW